MPADLTLISTEDMLAELGKRAEYLFVAASFPDAQSQAPRGTTGFLTVVPEEPSRMLSTLWMVGHSLKAMSKGDPDALKGITGIILAALAEDEEEQ